MRYLAASDVKDAFGTINPPPGSANIRTPGQGLGSLLANSIQLILVGGAVIMLFYLLWGGLDWILSGGDKERVAKARQKLTNAVIGMFIMVGALTLFTVITGDVLDIMKITPNGWEFNLPRFN